MRDLNDIMAGLSRLSLDAWIFIVLCVFLLAASGWLLWYWLRSRGRAQRVLRQLGCPFQRDLILPDGIGGQIHLDYLLLTPKGLVVLDLKNYRGTLFGADHIPIWTQMVRGGSYKFTNPLPQNALRVQAVKLLVGDVPVRGRVVFTDEGHFAKEPPAGVSLLDGLAYDLGLEKPVPEAPTSYQNAWHYLLEKHDHSVTETAISRQSA